MAFKDGFKTFPELTTKRLLLRQPVPDDAEAYFDGLATVPADIWGLRSESVEETRRFLAFRLRGYKNKAIIMWAIVERTTGALIGEVKLFEFLYQSKAEIGYWLDEKHRKKGYASEAVCAVLQFGFDVLGLHRIEAYTQPRNEASCALLARLGFVREGVLRQFRNEGGAGRNLDGLRRIRVAQTGLRGASWLGSPGAMAASGYARGCRFASGGPVRECGDN